MPLRFFRMKRSLRLVLAMLLIGSAAIPRPAGAGAILTLGSGFNHPAGVAVDANGNVFVADRDNNAVKEILAPGYTTINTVGSGFNKPSGVAVDSSGNVYVADSFNNAVKKILAPAYTTVTTLGSGFAVPSGVAVDASGNVFVADFGNSAVKKILAAGGYVTVTTLGSGFNQPYGVAVDASGNVFVGDGFYTGVKEILAPGYTTVNTLISGYFYPNGVALDGSGNLFVAAPGTSANTGVVWKVPAPGYTTLATINSSFFNQDIGVAVDGSGNVFVADTGNNAVKEITSAVAPTITKVFGVATVVTNGTTSLTFTVHNPNAGASLNGISFTDSLPAGLVVATPNGLTKTCGGTATAVAGASSASLSGATLAANASCTMVVSVQGTTTGVKNNSVQVSSTNGGTGNTSNASLTVSALQPPTITKAFGTGTILPNGTTSLTFTLVNPNAGLSLSGVAFTDSLPAGLLVATPNGLTTTCGGTATAVAGASSASLSGATLAANASCTMAVSVQGTTYGAKDNSVQVSSTNGGIGNTSNASLTVVQPPPSITKSFGAATMELTGITSLTFTLANPSADATLTGVYFVDNFPAGLQVATPNNLTNTCGGVTGNYPGQLFASVTGVTLAPNVSCTLALNVQATTLGVKNNSVQVNSPTAGAGNTSNASVTVLAPLPPTITKAFGVATIELSGTTSLMFTLHDPNAASSLTGVAFSDSLPAGLVVATPNGLTTTCGGTATAVAGASSASLSGATLAAGASCTMTVNVQGSTLGTKNNSVQVSSTNGGTGNTSNATLTVATLPPAITKAFGVATIEQTGTTSLTFTLTNPNASASLSGVAFTDSLPAGLVVTTPNGLTTTCGGTATAVAGATSASLSDATLAASASCTMVVSVQGSTLGVKNNSVQVSSTDGGTGNTSNASLTVLGPQPPAITKAFGAATIEQTALTSLTFSLHNPNSVTSLTGVAFTDSLPAGLVVATPNGLTSTCGGTATAVAGASAASLSAETLAAGASCMVAVSVQGTTLGVKNNSVQVTSTNGGAGNTSNASVTVSAPLPPTITKAFGAATIQLNGTTSLTFTLANPNAIASLTGVAFTDSLPAGLVVATPNGLTNTCGGSATAVAGATAASLSSVTLAAGASCTMAVSVRGATLGAKNNSVEVTSTDGGTGNTSNASLTVATLPPSIAKSFGAATTPLNGTTSLTFTLSNPNASASLTGIVFSDSLPAGMVVATPNGLTTTCGGSATAVAGSSSANLSGATLAAGASCTMAVSVQGTTLGVKNNSVQATSTNGGTGNTSNASLTITTPLPPTIAKTFSAATITLNNGTAALTFTVANPNAGTYLTGVAFTDAFPAGLLVATPNGLTNTCGGTATADAGATSASLSGAALAGGASCAMTVDVQGTAIGIKDNSVQVTSTEAGNGNTANATLKVWSCARGDTTFCDGFDPAIVSTLHDFGIYSPLGVAVDTSGNVVVTDNSSAVIKILAPGYTTIDTLGSGFNQPTGITVDATGNVFVADQDAVREMLAPAYTTINTLGSGFFVPRGVAVDASGNVFVADSINGAVKLILAPAYTTVNTLSSGYITPLGIAIDASGNVFLPDTFANQVREILAPAYTTVITLGSGFNQPYGTAVDAHGNVFVADKGNNAVKKILAPGYTTVITLGSGFYLPFGVAVDADGNVFVADRGNNALKVILAPGGHP